MDTLLISLSDLVLYYFITERALGLISVDSPSTMTEDLPAFNWYRHLSAYVATVSSIARSSSGELATKARSSTYTGEPQ